ncbi:dTDP-glucose 4,6-dehydratase [Adlercreutzia equolifaciens]|uniref:dTDP-glucose 4,6-dehydratase n=1 Tax=Adlercreutzia equolifaciens TaxID=446660 RepID=UPI0023B09B4B|nr:dTDP-glucose 4,6-dehydratase [Adlercreutzia equolifaciens]MDE8702807.1 dTDP-glucose 4,6-dehydratase [Adlercreutzia equolifaciens]
MKTYLVTGGAGFIGSNFVLYLLDKYDDIRVVNVDALTYAGNRENLRAVESDPRHIFVQADIRDTAAIEDVLATYDPDYVVNFAAESHVDRSIANPGAFADTNVMGTVSMLNAVRRAWEQEDGTWRAGKRYLQVGTDEVYGSLPLDDPEAFFREDTPLNPHSPYSASKAAADQFVLAYHDTYGMPVVVTRCSNNYGPFQFPEKLIPLMIRNALAHEPLPVYGDGLNVRDWLFVEDHCKAIDRVLEQGRLGQVYNVGGHNERPNIFIVKKIIEECASATNDEAITEELISYVEDRKGHDRRYGIAPDKIRAEIGWEPETAFEDGIVRTIDWYLDNQEWLDHVLSGEYRSYVPAAEQEA